jgi:hypothetical protein
LLNKKKKKKTSFLDIYKTFVIEEKFGFNKQTWLLYVWDTIKSILVQLIIGVPVFSAFLHLIIWGLSIELVKGLFLL